MELITAEQLAKHEKILDQIKLEHEKNERLKKALGKGNAKLIAARLAADKDFAKKHIFRVQLKIFDSSFEIMEVYGEQINLSEHMFLRVDNSTKYYLLQIYTSKAFRQKRIDEEWVFNILVENSRLRLNRSVKANESSGDPLLVVIPFDNSTETATVVTHLLLPVDGVLTVLEISRIVVDVSYHFAPHQESNSIEKADKDDNIRAIILSENQTIPLSDPKLEYKFSCKCSDKHFFESFVKNCYHRLGPDILSSFTESNSEVIRLELSVGGKQKQNATITLDKGNGSLSIVAEPLDLYHIKKYFIGEITCGAPILDEFTVTALTVSTY